MSHQRDSSCPSHGSSEADPDICGGVPAPADSGIFLSIFGSPGALCAEYWQKRPLSAGPGTSPHMSGLRQWLDANHCVHSCFLISRFVPGLPLKSNRFSSGKPWETKATRLPTSFERAARPSSVSWSRRIQGMGGPRPPRTADGDDTVPERSM